ncbi:cysteine desulfurase family protein [Microbacterium esteraromaticum]|uniref:cysteine desulfurase family protein n=1 Tax=Microbacterium esteraromaticum TaxID=57043 RepID=UPI0023684FD7|nr:cysteine desulfurase family protein [Microbacterium esteraromaticum]WDH79738.1 cysteine desulfurase family protein [Microbacterium esteraromaticum]
MLYLDHAATSPVRPEVLEAMRPYLTGVFGNPSSHHTVGEAAAEALEWARSRVAVAMGMRTGDVVFTAGGTESNNLAVKGIVLGAMSAAQHRRPHVITTPIEHESILESAHYLQRFHDARVTLLPVDAAGTASPADLTAALADGATLVSFGHANNEIGTVQDTAALIATARELAVPVHVDAVQSAGWLDLSGLGADAVSIAGHKLGTPKGIGALGVRGRVPLEPLLHGGGQERGRRSGTENVAGAVGLATALDLIESEREQAVAAVTAQTAEFIAAVLHSVPQAELTGSPDERLPNLASFTFAGTSGEAVLLELERRGVVSSSGSACAAGSDDPSPVLLALGIPAATAQTSVRFTFGRAPLPPGSAAHLAALTAAAVDAVR